MNSVDLTTKIIAKLKTISGLSAVTAYTVGELPGNAVRPYIQLNILKAPRKQTFSNTYVSLVPIQFIVFANTFEQAATLADLIPDSLQRVPLNLSYDNWVGNGEVSNVQVFSYQGPPPAAFVYQGVVTVEFYIGTTLS